MPKPAQDRYQRGPIAALLILLGLFLGSGPAAATGAGIAQPAARMAAGRPGQAALLHASARSLLDDEAPDGRDRPLLRPARPDIVTLFLSARPHSGLAEAADLVRPPPGDFLYRARAPPAA